MNIILKMFSWIVASEIPGRLRDIDKTNKIVCVYAHNPEKYTFEKVILWFLKRKFTFITPDELIEIKQGRKNIKRPIWLSFDDGWRGNYTNIYPVLENYKIPGTFFISTRPIENGMFWWEMAKRSKLNLGIESLDVLWDIPNKLRRDIIDKIDYRTEFRDSLTVNELKIMSMSKFITIGNHTDDHVICTKCEKKELIDEISKANKKLLSWTGKKTKYFAFPGGRKNAIVVQTLKSMKFKLAATTEQKLATLSDDLFNIPRVGIKDRPETLYENITMALGIRQKYVRYLKTIYKKNSIEL